MIVEDPLKFLFFDFKTSKIKANICSLILSTYLGTVWSNRNSVDFNNLKYKFIAALKYNVKTILVCDKVKTDIKELLVDMDTNIGTITL